jgi:hypothetical protein
MKKLFFGIPFLVLALVACPQPQVSTIGSSGGTVTSSNAVASLTFPAGALTTDTAVTITENASPPAVPSNQKIVAGKTFNVAGGTGNFAANASLKIKLEPSEIAALGLGNLRPQAIISQVVALQLNGTAWTSITYTFDTSTNTVTISIPGYGTYTLVVPNTPAVGLLSSIALTCTPTSISVAATSTCTAIAKDSSNTALSPQPSFSFTSSDTTKATVSSAGVVTGVASGSSNITASSGGITSNAVAVMVTAAPSGGGVTFVSTDPQARGKAISANGRVFFTTTSTQYVYDGTTSKVLPALPSGYTSISFDAYARPCIDSNGNVSFMAYKTGRINHAVFYDAIANSISEIPFGEENFVFGCNDAKQVVASDFNRGQKTHFKWQANDASATQLSRQSPDGISGYRPLGFNNSGTVLFPDGILKGTSFTSIPQISPFGLGLTNTGTVYGLNGKQQLWKWNEGDAALTLLGTVPGPIQDSDMRLINVNNNGDVLLRATGLASSTDYQYWLYKNGVYTRIIVPNYTILEAIGISDDGSVLANVYNSENFGGNYRVALFKP